jgi:hypothetical protein
MIALPVFVKQSNPRIRITLHVWCTYLHQIEKEQFIRSMLLQTWKHWIICLPPHAGPKAYFGKVSKLLHEHILRSFFVAKKKRGVSFLPLHSAAVEAQSLPSPCTLQMVLP